MPPEGGLHEKPSDKYAKMCRKYIYVGSRAVFFFGIGAHLNWDGTGCEFEIPGSVGYIISQCSPTIILNWGELYLGSCYGWTQKLCQQKYISIGRLRAYYSMKAEV